MTQEVCVRVRVPTATLWAKIVPGGLLVDTEEAKRMCVHDLRVNLFELECAMRVLTFEERKLRSTSRHVIARARTALLVHAQYKPFAIIELNASREFTREAHWINDKYMRLELHNPAWPGRNEI